MPSSYVARWPIAAFGVVFAAMVSFARADANSEFEQRREEERKNYDNLVSNMPPLDERAIGDILRISVENKVLVVRTPLGNSEREGFMRVKISDIGLTALIRVTGIPPAATRPAKPVVFQFQCTDCRKPLQIATLAVNLQPTTFTINKSSQYPSDGFGNICLTQPTSEASAAAGPVQLTVNKSASEGVAPINIALQEADFFTFVRLHPQETDAYIRPLLRELGQESVFAPDQLVVWQVFGEIWNPDPVITRRVQELLPALDQDDFRARGQALSDLEKLGREGAEVLLHLDRRTLTPEQNARIDLALDSYPLLPVKEATRLRNDPIFLLDCLYSDDIKLRKIALDCLRKVIDAAIDFDISAGPEARAAKVSALRQKFLGAPKQ